MQTAATFDTPSAPIEHPEQRLPMALPTRIISYAWGEKYLNELLSVALPALLAPGNLPYVATSVPCEVVLLTEQKYFARVLASAAVVRIQEFCPVRLYALDDLIGNPDKYGMALTYALHRGFADLGTAVTDRWLMFLNADFILADGSLRTVVGRLAEGERLVASPSYCVNAEAVTPLLLDGIDAQTGALILPPRDLATLVLQNRHNTIRGKTVNRPLFSVRYMDQFYWEVDSHTLLGHQMPIAIVGMRPERHLSEPNSYWDHGLMREFVPTAAPCVIGDSDAFLMLELRSERIADDQLAFGWPEPAEIARNTISFMTGYQRDMAQYPLTLHDRDLPDTVDEARGRLRAYVDGVLAHTRDVLPSHLDHPQWNYHQPGFIKNRHEYLSRRLGPATIGRKPPEGLSGLDRLWWELDGLKKSHAQSRRALEELRDHQRRALGTVESQLDDRIQSRRREIDAELVSDFCRISVGSQLLLRDLEGAHLLPEGDDGPREPTLGDDAESGAWEDAIKRHFREWAILDAETRRKQQMVTSFTTAVAEALEWEYQNRLSTLDLEFERASRQLQSDYERLVEHRVKSATIPYIAMERGPKTTRLSSRSSARQLARRAYSSFFGAGARLKRIHPQWAPLRHLVRLVDQAARDGAADVLIVVGQGGVADTAADALPGVHARVSMTEVLDGDLAAALNREPQFDLCLCTLDAEEIGRFSDLVAAVAPCLRRPGRILGFYPNLDLLPLPVVGGRLLRRLSEGPGTVRVHFAGSPASARVLMRFRKAAAAAGQQSRLLGFTRIAASLVFLAPQAFFANRREALAAASPYGATPDPCSSVMIEVTL